MTQFGRTEREANMATAAISPSLEPAPTVSESDSLYEVVDGRRMEKNMGAREDGIGNVLAQYVFLFLGAEPPGRLVVEMLFELQGARKLQRRPDVAYVPFERWPQRIIPATDSWPVSPAWAVEVISKTNTASDVECKIHEYFEAGVLMVWVIYPQTRTIYTYEGPKNVRILDDKDVLDGGKVLPGFHLPVRKLFDDVARTADSH